MRWAVFATVAFLALVAQSSFMGAIEVGGVRPNLMAVVALFVSLWAPRATALWGCAILGILVDLSSPVVYDGFQSTHLIGPYALGFTAGCAVMLQVRAMVMRRQLIAMAVLAGAFALVAGIVVTVLVTVRSWLPGIAPELAHHSAGSMVLFQFGTALFTMLAAIPLGWLLTSFSEKWRFQTMPGTAANWR